MNFIYKLHQSFLTGRIPLIFTFLFFVLFRFLHSSEETDAALLWGSSVIQASTAFFLLYLNQTFIMIRERSLLPAFFYLLLTGTTPRLFSDIVGSASALAVSICFYFLFSSYQKTSSQKEALNIGLLIAIISMFWLPALILFPLFWYGMYKFKSFNLKTFAATLTGLFIVYLFVFSWSVYIEDLEFFTGKFSYENTLAEISLLSRGIEDWLVIGLLVILLVLSGINLFMAGISEKIRAITTLSFLYFFSFIVFILSLIGKDVENNWILILYIPLSYLFAHYFTLTTQKWTSWLFVFSVLFFIVLYFLIENRFPIEVFDNLRNTILTFFQW